MTPAEDIVARLRRVYASHADPVRADGEAAYMRHQFAFFGMRTADRRRLTDLPPPTDGDDLRAVVRALWAEPEREFQHAGCDYLRAHVALATVDLLHEVVTAKSWWDTVDPLASHVAGPMVRRRPELVEVMDRWITDGNFWVARTAILHQMTFKQHTDAERLFRYCRLRAGDREFFLRKAIGTALRTYAATDPDAVAAFVAATPELSALSVREAMKGVTRRSGARPG